MKRYLIILCLVAGYPSATALAEDAAPASNLQIREALEQSGAAPSLSANEQARQDKQDEKPQIVATEKTRSLSALPYLTGGFFGSAE